MSMPRALYCSAAISTARVGEVAIRPTRSANLVIESEFLVNKDKLFLRFLFQALFNNWRHQPVNGSAQLRNFTDQPGAQITVRLSGHHENRFDVGLKFAVHQRHLQFVFVIADGANSAQNYLSFSL